MSPGAAVHAAIIEMKHPGSSAAGTRAVGGLSAALNATDKLLLAFWGLLSILSLALHSRVPPWPALLLADFCAGVLVCALALAARAGRCAVLRWFHDWAAFPLLVFTYKQLYFITGPIHLHRDYDPLLIAADLWLFGAHPTHWLSGFSNPALTEALQIAYTSFYVLFLAAGFELYRDPDRSRFRRFRFTVVYGFLICYLGYTALPAVGPRFTLHDFARVDAELPGMLLTHPLRRFINVCESIPPGASSAVALARVQRDVFPSGHAMMTLVTVILAYRYRLKIRVWLLALGALLIFGSVYLRYHYVSDMVAGALLVPPCLLTSKWVCRRMGGHD